VIEVRRLHHDEWRELRQIRLEALRDSPEAFFTTLAQAEAHPDSLWQDRARMAALGDDQATAIAIDGPRIVGMTTGLLRPDITPDVVAVVSVFVSADVRRRGVGAAMLSVIEQWAARCRASQTSLWVVETNDSALRFYESVGYRATTDRQMVPSLPPRYETRFVKALAVSR